MISQWRILVQEDAALINEHIDDLKVFSEELQAYWLHTPKDRKADEIAATKVRAKFGPVANFYGEAQKRMHQERYRDYQASLVKLFNVGQGGTFDTDGREFDADKAVECYQIVADLILNLRLARKEQLYFTGMFSRWRAKMTFK